MELKIDVPIQLTDEEGDPKLETNWHIHVSGRVQGVGFRPYIYQKAVAANIKGQVSNGQDGVHIRFTANRQKAELFLKELIGSVPKLAVVTDIKMVPISKRDFVDFRIVEEKGTYLPDLWITPDLGICQSCQSELINPADRRYRYPFITCTQCGPRYSIMKLLPFERYLTTMEPFVFCGACQKEYDNPVNRRFFAQTISCKTCGVKLEWVDSAGEITHCNSEEMVAMACKALQVGKIIAVKGIGGFLLLADAGNENAVLQLRRRKHRPAKPFAILYPDIEHLQKDTHLSNREFATITSIEAPIVLLPISQQMYSSLAVEALAPGLDKLGIMLPYAPLLLLISIAFQKPMVATSGNVSGSPICFTNEDALTTLSGIADFFLLHNREIVAPQDDSVIAFSHIDSPAIFLRRSRGYAPAFENYQTLNLKSVLATGALMKSSFTLAQNKRVYISQYLGNTDGYEAQLSYRHTLQHMQQLLRFEPEVLITDAHPHYFSHQLAKQMAVEKQIPCYVVQHHKAHFAAALAEATLLESQHAVMGVVWDGTGMGDDGNSWGSEFFRYEKNRMERIAQLAYFPNMLGDKMAREPRLSALALLGADGSRITRVKAMFSEQEWAVYEQLLQTPPALFTCSMGRLFDAAACLITGISIQSYEGEAAMRLEALANSWVSKNGFYFQQNYLEVSMTDSTFSGRDILMAIMQDLEKGLDYAFIAAKFHATLVSCIEPFAMKANSNHICFSGGVFQNALLVAMIVEKYRKSFQLHFHRQLSPNDESISFGQLVYFDRAIE